MKDDMNKPAKEALDATGHFTIDVRAQKNGNIECSIDLKKATNQQFINNLERLVAIVCDDKLVRLKLDKQNMVLTTTLPAPVSGDLHFVLASKHQARDLDALKQHKCFSVYHAQNGTVSPDADNRYRRLTVSETRMLSRGGSSIPYPRDMAALKQLDSMPILTDLHTHLTGQISGGDLLKIAKDKNALYPVELLEKLGIARSHLQQPFATMKSCEFSPASKEGLLCEKRDQDVPAIRITDLLPGQLHKLEAALDIPVDQIYTFNDVEMHMFRFRNSLTKNPDLIAPIIDKVAARYKEQGVQYAELSVNAAKDPEWLEAAIPALEKAEKDHGVSMRLLFSIFRGFNPDRMMESVKLAELAMQSPYVAGIDFLGYEIDKTTRFTTAMHHFARRQNHQASGVNEEHPYWDYNGAGVIRVHAGESRKNLENVKEAMHIADEYNVPLRIGHGIWIKVDDEFKRLAKSLADKKLIAVELNPDSNIALNNIDCLTALPHTLWRELGVPMVLSTDGAGSYQTTMRQTSQAGLFAGMSIDELEKIRTHEKEFIADRKKEFEAKKALFETQRGDMGIGFFADYRALSEQLKKEAKGELNNSSLKRKKPILIAGASGNSWADISPADQIEIETSVRMLVQLLDPEKTYFAVGRIKDSGITHILDKILSERWQNSSPQAPQFSMLGLFGNLENIDRLPENLTHVVSLGDRKQDLMNVVDELVKFVLKTDAHALLFHGNQFTRTIEERFRNNELLDMPGITEKGEHKHVHYGLYYGAGGATHEKALTDSYHPDDRPTMWDRHVFSGALTKSLPIKELASNGAPPMFRIKGMIDNLIDQQKEAGTPLFRDDADLSPDGLKTLYEKTKVQVQENYDHCQLKHSLPTTPATTVQEPAFVGAGRMAYPPIITGK